MDIIFRIESQEEFQKAVWDIINNFYSSSNVSQMPMDSSVIKTAKDDLIKLLLDSNFDTNNIPELISDKNWDGEKTTFFINLINEKKTELLYASLLNQNNKYGEIVTSFDWLLKLVLGTSEMNTLKYPLLQLILSTDSNGIQKKVMYDMNMDMVSKTIDTLEKLDKI